MIPTTKMVVVGAKPTATHTFLESIVEDMVLWWDMQDTGDTLTDLSGNNNTGTVTNATNTTISDRNWKRCDGTGDYITGSLPALSSWTVGGVFIRKNSDEGRFFGTTNYNIDVLIAANGSIYCYPSGAGWIDTDTDIVDDTPYFLFIDYDESKGSTDSINVYLNGEPIDVISASKAIVESTLYLGADYELGTNLNADFGMFTVIDRVLTPEEHLQLFNEEKSKYGIS